MAESVAFGYCRVSTAGQVEDGHSLATQKAAIEAHYQARLAGVAAWGGVFTDSEKTKGARNGVSGKTRLAERPAGSVLADRLRPGDHVIVNDMTRAFRNFADAVVTTERWIERGIGLHIVRDGIDTTTVPGRMFVRFMALFAQMEREMVSERTREVLRARKKAGKTSGGLPGYGKRYEGIKGHRRVVPDLHEIETMDLIVRMHDTENMEFDQIWLAFIKGNIKTRRGMAWSRSRIWRAYQARKASLDSAGRSP